MRLNYLPAAEADLDEIYIWIARDDPEVAARVIRQVVAAARRLRDHPESAPLRPEIASGVRSLVVGRYLLLYRIEADRIDVVRVVHGARDVPGLVGD